MDNGDFIAQRRSFIIWICKKINSRGLVFPEAERHAEDADLHASGTKHEQERQRYDTQ